MPFLTDLHAINLWCFVFWQWCRRRTS